MRRYLMIVILLSLCISGLPQKPIDPQVVRDQDEMTWEDYKPIPGKNWADPSLAPERKFRMALVAVDFPDQPFVITQPKNSDLFGNPRIDPVKREEVVSFENGASRKVKVSLTIQSESDHSLIKTSLLKIK